MMFLSLNLAELTLVVVSALVFFGGGYLYWVGLQEDRRG